MLNHVMRYLSKITGDMARFLSYMADGSWYYDMFLTFHSQLAPGYVKVDFGTCKSILI